jgi:hypothetical protein
VQKCYDEVKKMVGDPTQQVVLPLGNIFYVNDVAKAIAKVSFSRSVLASYTVISPLVIQDYANPLTRLAMQDFPEDGGSGMSQIFNGEKMLHELPSPLAVRVNSSVYFVRELLQESSGGYFIPKHFFLATPPSASTVPTSPTEQTPESSVRVLFALGRSVTCTNVSESACELPYIKG